MLTETERATLHDVLTKKRQHLIQNAQQGLTDSMNREQEVGGDSIDESTQENLLATELRLRDREKWLLGKIDHALDRLERGTIDECEECGEAIGLRRLLARPVTTLCIDCKESREREEIAIESGGRGLAGPGFGDEMDEVGASDE